MDAHINKDTKLCMSLSARPGNFGTRFHNFLYRELGLNFVYKAFTTQDLPAAIGGVRALGIRGCAVSMPFKEVCIQFLDAMDSSALGIESVNTIVNTDGQLKGYNTDYQAVRALLEQRAIPTETSFALRGSGGMAKAVACALRDLGFTDGVIVARNEASGSALAKQYGFRWAREFVNVSAGAQSDPSSIEGAGVKACENMGSNRDFASVDRPFGLLINVTPVGMAGGADADALAFTEAQIAATRYAFDVVAIPAQTPFIKRAIALGKPTITGAEVIVLQAVEQFVLYTGVRPNADVIARAAAFARG